MTYLFLQLLESKTFSNAGESIAGVILVDSGLQMWLPCSASPTSSTIHEASQSVPNKKSRLISQTTHL